MTKYSTILGVFQQPWPEVSPTAILNEEKALGTRLKLLWRLDFRKRILAASFWLFRPQKRCWEVFPIIPVYTHRLPTLFIFPPVSLTNTERKACAERLDSIFKTEMFSERDMILDNSNCIIRWDYSSITVIHNPEC